MFERMKQKLARLKLSSEHLELVSQRFSSLLGPLGFINTSRDVVNKLGQFTIHDCHIFLATNVGKFCLRHPVLSGRTYQVFCGISDIIARLASYQVDMVSMGSFKQTMIDTLVLFEQVFPQSEHTINFHLLIHMFDTVLQFGPVYYYWMYVFERMLGHLVRKTHGRFKIETNMINVHLLDVSQHHLFLKHKHRFVSHMSNTVLSRLFPTFSQDILYTQVNSYVKFPPAERPFISSVHIPDPVLHLVSTRINQPVSSFTTIVFVKGVVIGSQKRTCEWTRRLRVRRQKYSSSWQWFGDKTQVALTDYFIKVKTRNHPHNTFHLAKVELYGPVNDELGVPHIPTRSRYHSTQVVSCEDLGDVVCIGSDPSAGEDLSFVIETHRFDTYST